MPVWTDEQKKAIELTECPIIVSAAAGSGKTAVLVERTVNLLCDETKNIPADTLLAVTFTNDAASQMSRKLSLEIDRRAESDPDNVWLQRQQALLRLAEITTINSFCFSLVKDNLSDTDFQTGIRILEENEASMITDRALTKVLEREYEESGEDMEDLISVFCRENDAALRGIILQLYRFLRTLPFKDIWIKSTLSAFNDGTAAKAVKNDISERVKEKLGEINLCARRLSGIAEMLEYHSSVRTALYENADAALSLCDAAESLSTLEISQSARTLVFSALNGRQTKAEKERQSEIELAAYESAKELNAHLKDLVKELACISSPSDSEIEKDSKISADYFGRLCGLCQKLEDEVYKMKVERNAVDFADTELMTVRLLVNCSDSGALTRTPLCEEIVNSRRYRLILIDEFQDVNNLQEVIFKAISDTDDLGVIGKNVFAVGDVKQAIYRFRQANPMIFMKTRMQGKSSDSPVRELLLRKNFRSRKAVIDFCNYIFSSLMSPKIGETEYTDEETLYPGADYPGPDAPTEIITINSGGDEDAGTLEFTAAARKIRRIIDSGATVTDNGAIRPCCPSDFCVLTRNNVSSDDVKEIFMSENLKILSFDSSGYLKSREISLLLNLLAIISNPMRDIPLASVLLSPICAFSDDDLAVLRLISREDKLYKTVLRVSEGDGAPFTTLELREKCKSAVKLIKKLSVYSSGLSLTRLIRKIYDLTDIFNLASAYEDAEQKCANLYLLLEYARAYEQSSPDGISGFLRYIDYISRTGGDFEQALTVTENEDAVVLKTIHSSKGLEYPFVILCQTGKRFNKTDLNGALQLSNQFGAGFKFLDYKTLTKRPTVYWDYVRRKNLSELLSEELRLMYVALTRARERIFIVLNIGEKELKRVEESFYEIQSHTVPPFVASKAVCQADWLMMALCKHPAMEVLRKNCDTYTNTENLPEIKVSPMPEKSQKTDTSEKINARPDPELVKKLTESFSYVTETRLTRSEAKLTVSEIVKDDVLSFFPEVPSLDASLEEFTAARRGTLTHRFMQFCDFEKTSENLGAEVSRLTENGVFTPHESEAIDRRGVENFFKSGIYSRLKQSKNVLREQRFIVRFDDIAVDDDLKKIYAGTDGMLQGVADCLFREPDGYVLVDYKTDRVRYLEELKKRYSAQLMLYKAAFDVLLDAPVKSSYIYSFRLGNGIEIKA